MGEAGVIWSRLTSAFLMNCQLFGLTLLFALPLGLLVSLGSMSRFTPLRGVVKTFVWIIRGTPLMLQIIVIYLGPGLMGFASPWGSSTNGRLLAAVVAFVINYAAYFAEIFRSGIQSIDGGQTEAARSLGLSQGQNMRFIILPQAIKNILPALGNEFVTVIKESSIVSIIGIADLMYRTNGVMAITYIQLEPLAIAAIIYFAMTFTTSRLIAFAERRMSNAK